MLISLWDSNCSCLLLNQLQARRHVWSHVLLKPTRSVTALEVSHEKRLRPKASSFKGRTVPRSGGARLLHDVNDIEHGSTLCHVRANLTRDASLFIGFIPLCSTCAQLLHEWAPVHVTNATRVRRQSAGRQGRKLQAAS